MTVIESVEGRLFDPDPSIDERITRAHSMLDDVLNRIELDGKRVVAVVGLFSGGNDSTTLCHLFKDRVNYFAHANTQVGIEPTREYVRATSRQWGVELLEGLPVPGRTYEDLILGQAFTTSPRAKHPMVWPGGFPGYGGHRIFFAHLKESWLERVRGMLIENGRKERVVFLGGRRAAESGGRKKRFADHGPVNTSGANVWVEPMHNWTHRDMGRYRDACAGCPRNEVADQLHMSGECLCGCYAHPGEYEELKFWQPGFIDYVDDLTERLSARGLDIPAYTLKWGWNREGRCATGVCNT